MIPFLLHQLPSIERSPHKCKTFALQDHQRTRYSWLSRVFNSSSSNLRHSHPSIFLMEDGCVHYVRTTTSVGELSATGATSKSQRVITTVSLSTYSRSLAVLGELQATSLMSVTQAQSTMRTSVPNAKSKIAIPYPIVHNPKWIKRICQTIAKWRSLWQREWVTGYASIARIWTFHSERHATDVNWTGASSERWSLVSINNSKISRLLTINLFLQIPVFFLVAIKMDIPMHLLDICLI